MDRPADPGYEQQCRAVLRDLSLTAQQLASLGEAARYAAAHEDINAALDLLEQAREQPS
jgi:hypothetical protein